MKNRSLKKFQIYNEEVRDLLTKNGEKLEIKEDGENGIYAGGLSLHHCHDVTQCQRLMQIGNDNRHVSFFLAI